MDMAIKSVGALVVSRVIGKPNFTFILGKVIDPEGQALEAKKHLLKVKEGGGKQLNGQWSYFLSSFHSSVLGQPMHYWIRAAKDLTPNYK